MKTLGLIIIFSSFWVFAVAQNPAQGNIYSESGDIFIELDANEELNTVWKDVDDLVFAFDEANISSYDQLASRITQGFSDDESRARSIYTWIALNISYDNKSIEDGTFREKQNALTVWERKTAVCEGFANLFQHMCKAAGLQSRIVKGYAKQFAASDFQFPNHAWNSVEIDGKWKLLDVTWASMRSQIDQISNQNLADKIHRIKLDHFFLVEPSRMIYTHLPEDPLWQLQDTYVNLETFINGSNQIEAKLANSTGNALDFEELIARYDALDSLDQSISYLERMECPKSNRSKNYGLGIAYYYKAQQLLNGKSSQAKAVEDAIHYYEQSLKELSKLRKEDYGYEFSKDLVSSVEIRLASLQRTQLTNF